MAVIQSSLSDHNHIYLELKRFKRPPKKIHHYTAIDYTKLYKDVSNTNDITADDDYHALESFIKDKVKTNTKKKSKILNLPRDDWINRKITREIDRRNTLWRKSKNEPNNNDFLTEFIAKRNEVHHFMKQEKRQYFFNKFSKCKSNPKKMWSLINYLSNNNPVTTCNIPKLNVNNKTINDPIEVCETFNNFFASVGKRLATQIPHKFHNNLTYTTINSNPNSNQLDTLTPCTSTEIIKIIDNLDPCCSSGIDGITTKTIQCIKNLIAANLTNCINNCFKNGTFPDTLKIAKVNPIYKSGTKSDPGNYRPISVLPVLSKIFERLIYTRLEKYLNDINYIYDRQFGFRPKSNTLCATIDLVTTIKTNIDNKNIAVGIFIDLKKAFDTVSHKILLLKLKTIGITGEMYNILSSYLENRKQIVKMGNAMSGESPIEFGVPQGSLLSTLLFTIYINNIKDLGLIGQLTLYADDTCLFYFGNNINTIVADAQKDLDTLYNWFSSNLLTINASKTSYMIFSAKNKKISIHPDLHINNNKIIKSNCEKYLGLRLDNKLNWQAHIDYIKSKITSLIGSMRGYINNIPKKIRYDIYNSLIRSHINYLIEIWGCATKSTIKDLQIAQNKIIKLLFNYDYDTPTSELYKHTKLMSIHQLYTFNSCILIRKILNKTIHTQLSFNMKTSKYSQRNPNQIQTSAPRTQYGRKNINYEGVQLYNNLPADVRSTSSFNLFKAKLKQYVANSTKLLT